MILYLDVRNDRVAVAAVRKDGVSWSRSLGPKIGPALSRGLRAAKGKVTTVVVARGTDRKIRDASWSANRAAVAAGNAIAFAWGVPVTMLDVRGDETPRALLPMIRSAATSAVRGVHVRPAYDGEPNITTPKKP